MSWRSYRVIDIEGIAYTVCRHDNGFGSIGHPEVNNGVVMEMDELATSFVRDALRDAICYQDTKKLLVCIRLGLPELYTGGKVEIYVGIKRGERQVLTGDRAEILARIFEGKHVGKGRKANAKGIHEQDEEIWQRIHYHMGITPDKPVIGSNNRNDAVCDDIIHAVRIGTADGVRRVWTQRGGHNPKGINLITAKFAEWKGKLSSDKSRE